MGRRLDMILNKITLVLLFYMFFNLLSSFHVLASNYGCTNVLDTYDFDEGHAIITTSTGDVVIVGYTRGNSSGKKDVAVIKIDELGNVLWNVTWGGEEDDIGYDLCEAYDGGYIIVGEVGASGTFPSYIGGEVLILKLDVNGNYVWHQGLGGEGWDRAKSVIKTFDGHYLVLCKVEDFMFGKQNIQLIKIDDLGNIIWRRSFTGPTSYHSESFVETIDENYLITGTLEKFGDGKKDVFLIKVNSAGSFIWERTYGGINDDEAYSIISTEEDNYIIVGSTKPPNTDKKNVYVIKINFTGNIIWEKTFGGELDDYAYHIHETIDMNYVIVGTTYSWGENSPNILFIIITNQGIVIYNNSIDTDYFEVGISAIDENNGDAIILFNKWEKKYDICIYRLNLEKKGLSILSDYGITTGSGEYYPGTEITFSVEPSTYNIQNAERMVFAGWVSSSPDYHFVHNSEQVVLYDDLILNAEWKIQYYVSVSSDVGGYVTPSSGWHDEGATLTFTAVPNIGYRFTSWLGVGTNSYNGDETKFSSTILGPLSQIAHFEPIPTYSLILQSEYGAVFGDGNYSEHKLVNFYVSPATVYEDEKTRHLFSEWVSKSLTGYRGENSNASVHLENDIVETAIWDTQYYVNITKDEGGEILTSSGWYNEGEYIDISAISFEGFEFFNWAGVGMGSYTGELASVSIQVRGPITQRANFRVLPIYLLHIISDQVNFSKTIHYYEGEIATIELNLTILYEGDSKTRYMFKGWVSNSSEGYTGKNNPATVFMGGEITQEAIWKRQYYLQIDSPISIDLEGWYDENTEINLISLYKGVLIRNVLRYKLDTGEKFTNNNVLMNKPLKLTLYWDVDYSQLYLFLSFSTIFSALLLKVKQNNDYRSKKGIILEEIQGKYQLQIYEAARRYKIRYDTLIKMIGELLNNNVIEGYFDSSKTRFLTIDSLQRELNDRLLTYGVMRIDNLATSLNFNEKDILRILNAIDDVQYYEINEITNVVSNGFLSEFITEELDFNGIIDINNLSLRKHVLKYIIKQVIDDGLLQYGRYIDDHRFISYRYLQDFLNAFTEKIDLSIIENKYNIDNKEILTSIMLHIYENEGYITSDNKYFIFKQYIIETIIESFSTDLFINIPLLISKIPILKDEMVNLLNELKDLNIISGITSIDMNYYYSYEKITKDILSMNDNNNSNIIMFNEISTSLYIVDDEVIDHIRHMSDPNMLINMNEKFIYYYEDEVEKIIKLLQEGPILMSDVSLTLNVDLGFSRLILNQILEIKYVSYNIYLKDIDESVIITSQLENLLKTYSTDENIDSKYKNLLTYLENSVLKNLDDSDILNIDVMAEKNKLTSESVMHLINGLLLRKKMYGPSTQFSTSDFIEGISAITLNPFIKWWGKINQIDIIHQIYKTFSGIKNVCPLCYGEGQTPSGYKETTTYEREDGIITPVRRFTETYEKCNMCNGRGKFYWLPM